MKKFPISHLLYQIGVGSYFGGINILSKLNPKAKLMVEGRRNLLQSLSEKRIGGESYIWIHASSLGEFEQGRPLIEALKKFHPEYKICLTFFSPSGYQMRKDYPLADIVTYLPFDNEEQEVRQFIQLLAPEMAIFVKYEFWLNALRILNEEKIATFLISAKFRESQPFFKPWGNIFRAALRDFDHIYVQDVESEHLLRRIGVRQVSVAGDSRADRVQDIASKSSNLPLVSAFVEKARSEGKVILVVGSSWEKDEALYLPFLKKNKAHIATIIAPHEVGETRISELINSCPPLRSSLYSKGILTEESEILIIDKIGLLSSIYRYADIAYIGGGFGAGIHNTLEPSVYGLPVLFGPKYKKFPEAEALIKNGGGFTFKRSEELINHLTHLISDEQFREKSGNAARQVVQERTGATQKILDGLFSGKF